MSGLIDVRALPAARLIDAIGGLERITGVQTFVRETVRRVSEDRFCVTTYRAAGGRLRIETRPLGDDEEDEDEAALDILIVPPADAPRAAEVLREARLEPRNLLAHLHERPATLRSLPDGGLEIELSEEPVVYVFDLGSGLCAKRLDRVSGEEVRYVGWLRIDGIATPFREIRRGAGEWSEERLIAAAYDAPLPDELFSMHH